MRLILSTRHPRNSTYTTDSGQVLYKVDKPHKLCHGVATIRKAVPTVNGVWQDGFPQDTFRSVSLDSKSSLEKGEHISERYSSDSKEHYADSDVEAEHLPTLSIEPTLEGHFAFYAQVEFHTFQSSRFRYNGMSMGVNDYFRKEGWSIYGSNRVFKASDGKEYRWELRLTRLEMVTNDGSKKPVVRFREWIPHLGPTMRGRPAILEIDPSCEPILDEVIMTFVYCQKLRKTREERHQAQMRG